MQNFNLASAYVTALTGDPNTVMDWRCLSDVDKGAQGQNFRGTLADAWQWLCSWNDRKHGCFVSVSAMDGYGRSLPNVTAVRAHVVDHDSLDALQQAQSAAAWHPAPTFRVYSSPQKYHTYWCVEPYQDNDRFTVIQRKLRSLFNGDKAVIDATRVLRVPGTYNFKYPEPFLSHCEALPGFGRRIAVSELENALAHVQVIDTSGGRSELGDPNLAAPSLSWLKRALDLTDPNDLSRDEWIGFSAAFKQAGWTLASEAELYDLWSRWCSRYHDDNPAENQKNWRSFRETELGWKSLVHRVPSLRAIVAFGETPQPAPLAAGGAPVPPMPVREPPPMDCSGEILTHEECSEWFKGVTFVASMKKMLTPTGRLYDVTAFNGAWGGKRFIITQDGKLTDEPWKAATRSTLWRVPVVDHLRFLPMSEPGEVITDVLGRKGVNTYVKPLIEMEPGDITPFITHLTHIVPDPNDLRILLDWMAHVVRYPGFKIPWAPVIQSTEGIGKSVIKDVMTHAIGQPYTHFPNAQELAESGGKFNGWMRGKVFILADEIKVDEKRHLVEVLKPLISEKLIEVQSKGVDQEMEDNPANWGFFSNHKDCIPVSKNGRRYAMFFSPIQTEQDLIDRGMGDAYMKGLFAWLAAGGLKYVAHWLHNYPIERGDIPMRAPKTSSHAEAVEISRSPVERALIEAIEGDVPGFKGGWVSEIAALKYMRDKQVVRGNLPPHAVRAALEGMGYREIGKQVRPYFQEDVSRAGVLFGLGVADVSDYGRAQGYE